MIQNPNAYQAYPLGVVLRRAPGVTRWQPWVWRAAAVLPGAGPADWRELRREGEAVEFHAGTLMLELHGAETEAYVHGLMSEVPSVYIVMRDEAEGDAPLDLVLVTVSPYEAQDYAENGEDIVERVPMPDLLRHVVEDFVRTHHEEEVFVKRKRDRKRVDLVEDGVGDPRIGKAADIYASPAQIRGRLQ